MKTRSFTLVFIFIFIIIFSFFIVRLTNHNLGRTYRESYRNTFYLLSFIVEHYLQHEKEIEESLIEQLRKEIAVIAKNAEKINQSSIPENLQAFWIFKDHVIKRTADYEDLDDEIIDYYQQNLKGKNAHSLVFVADRPFFLVNTIVDENEILLLSEATGVFGIRIDEILDSLVVSSDLRYFAIVDKEQTPILFSTLYENFLPLKGIGHHVIKTPEGNIFQIEEMVSDNCIVAGFTMESLEKIISTNNLFLISVMIIFIVLEAVLLISFVKFERFKFKKEKEVNLLKEIGALSTGFAHEFRNSLHTLSLLAKDSDKEDKRILLEETNRMKSVMDSLRLIGMTEVESNEIKVEDVIYESISLLDSIIAENGVNIKKTIEKDLTIDGNRSLLVTAFSNIVKNSIEADAQNIHIYTNKKGKEISIEFIDDGKGISNAIINEIFLPFFSKKGQSGIGLYLVKRIIELHSGRIEVKSNRYTRFRITLIAK